MNWRKVVGYSGGVVAAAAVFYVSLFLLFQPSHDRVWELGHAVLPYISYSTTTDEVTVYNYRNFDWQDVMEAQAAYETHTFDLSLLTGVDVFISHFASYEGMAHVFFSFRFADGEHLVVSLETRRESDEHFSPLLGILRQYEIIYVVGAESDVVGVRTDERGERVYVYPLALNAAQTRQFFEAMSTKINDVYETPRVYNTLTHNCVNEFTRPVEDIMSVSFPGLHWDTIFPGYFDRELYEKGLLVGTGTFAEIKAAHRIDNDAVSADEPTYSADVRAGFGGE